MKQEEDLTKFYQSHWRLTTLTFGSVKTVTVSHVAGEHQKSLKYLRLDLVSTVCITYLIINLNSFLQ